MNFTEVILYVSFHTKKKSLDNFRFFFFNVFFSLLYSLYLVRDECFVFVVHQIPRIVSNNLLIYDVNEIV
jgi:hypothetical protein